MSWVNEWLLFNANPVIYRYIKLIFQWDDDEARFALDKHTEFDFSASSLQQQSAGWHVDPLGRIILIPSQPVFLHYPYCCVLSGEATKVFGLTRPNPRSTALEVSTLTIPPPMRLLCHDD